MSLVVLGDSLLDVDLDGRAARLCPDAPAPVLDLDGRRDRPGGAALAASLAAADGEAVTLVTALAADAEADRLRATLTGVSTVAGALPGSTTVKARLRAEGRSLARLDYGHSARPPATEDMLDAVACATAILVSDYGRGLTEDPRLRALLTSQARRIPVVWDPHPRGPDPVPGVRLATPNRAEALAAAGAEDEYEAAARLRRRWRAGAVAVTLGAGGALLDHGGTPVAVPAPPVTALDPCGAGDQFAAAATAALHRGAAVDEAVAAAVEQAADFLARGGAAGHREPPPAESTVDGLLRSVRARGGTVVATGGCFDLLHAGHIRMLAAARRLGDCLVVCLNSDDSVRRLKGQGRPVNPARERAELLRALTSVDAVVIFEENTPALALARLRPDVWVKGADYSADTLPEAGLLRDWGGHAVVVPYHSGRSTSRLVEALDRMR
ncbi:PfkB family carbohydrate kinase [Crossiella sp. CA198]|uniref:PfkB family carbohydrate kinase n=1 Tax=Crossiella sp. CA198 TaxID=3455607 RepID=UPI003F8D0FBA